MNEMPIGLFDSGLGGLTVLKALRDKLPGEGYLYLGDSARVPYGTKSPATVRRYARECASFLVEKGVKHIVVACNTASSVALEALQEGFTCPVTGAVAATARQAARVTRSGHIGVIGTRTTIASKAFESALHAIDRQFKVHPAACPLFVPLVEEGLFDGGIVQSTIAHYLSSFRKMPIDTLVLGCTHYPLLREALAGFFGPEVRIVTSAQAIADELSQAYGVSHAASNPGVSIFVTDDPSNFHGLAGAILGSEDMFSVEQIVLKELL